MQIFQNILIIGSLWVLWIFVKYNMARTKLAVLQERFNREAANFNIPKLCGYHTASLLRPGQIALLDSDNCEVCNAPVHTKR